MNYAWRNGLPCGRVTCESLTLSAAVILSTRFWSAHWFWAQNATIALENGDQGRYIALTARAARLGRVWRRLQARVDVLQHGRSA